MLITFEGWDPVDRQPVRGTLQGLDRAQTQAADLVTVQLSHDRGSISLKQNPTALQGTNIRVGAAVWDGAYVLAAYLDAQPQGTFQGLRCVELGCGLGLLGLLLARLEAAAVYLTDKPQFLVSPRVNAARNKLLAPTTSLPQPATAATTAGAARLARLEEHPNQQQQPAEPAAAQQAGADGALSPVVQVVGLDWEDASTLAAAAAKITADGHVDLIVASDCIYPDPCGSVPSSSGFIAAVAALATPGHTRVLTTFEARSDELRQALLTAAAALPGGCDVVRLEPEELPAEYRSQHVEVYELKLESAR